MPATLNASAESAFLPSMATAYALGWPNRAIVEDSGVEVLVGKKIECAVVDDGDHLRVGVAHQSHFGSYAVTSST
jgi:hypothetical protein